MGARLRRLREAGLVEAHGPTPSRWYPTAAGERELSRRRLTILRRRAREARAQTLATMHRAEELFAFAETLTHPVSPVLCAPRGHRRLSFGELVCKLEQSVGCEVLVSTDAGNVWPKVSPITAVGTISEIEEEREPDIGDWLVRLSVGDLAVVELSRHQFTGAEEDATMSELYIRQASQTTVICFDF